MLISLILLALLALAIIINAPDDNDEYPPQPFL